MKKISSKFFIIGLLLSIFFKINIFAEYIEGTDTTDVNGYGLDSAFQLLSDNILHGQKLACYFHYTPYRYGAFNTSFDDIKIAGDSLELYYPGTTFFNDFNFPQLTYCFVIKKQKDSTYSKVQITNKLADNRYVFKFGTNTITNERAMVASNYDRSIRYKPNNLAYHINGFLEHVFSWEPPLPNDNHLIGYLLYLAPGNINTTLPINLSEWNSVAFTDSTTTTTKMSFSYGSNAEFFNLVARYTEGNSEFLQGWTHLTPIMSANYSSKSALSISNRIEIKKTAHGFYFSLPQTHFSSSFSICALKGIQIFRSFDRGTRAFWNTSETNISPGLYIIKAELPDHTVLTQPFMFTK